MNTKKLTSMSNVTTRSQQIKNNEAIIKEYETIIKEHAEEKKHYELIIAQIKIDLNKKEKLNNRLIQESEVNCTEYERLCKENTVLKKKLAEEESKYLNLQSDLQYAVDFNMTLKEDQEEINSHNNSIIMPLKKHLNETQKEKELLQLEYNTLLVKYQKLQSSNKWNYKLTKRNYRSNRKVQKLRNKTREEYKNLNAVYKTLHKTQENIIEEIEIVKKALTENVLKLDVICRDLTTAHDILNSEITLIKEQKIKCDNHKVSAPSTRNNPPSDKIECTIIEMEATDITETTVRANTNNNKMSKDIENLIHDAHNPQEKSVDSYGSSKRNQINIQLIGDKSVKNLGILLNNTKDERIMCECYPNAPLKIILERAKKALYALSNNSNVTILALTVKHVKKDELKEYVKYIRELQEYAEKNNICFIYSNIRYHGISNSRLNRLIYSLNVQMYNIALYSHRSEIIDWNKIRGTTTLDDKVILSEIIKLFMKNFSNAKKRNDNENTVSVQTKSQEIENENFCRDPTAIMQK